MPEKKSFIVSIYAKRGGEVLLILHRVHGWVPVGGHIEPNESPRDAVLRELREELGWEYGTDYTFAPSPLPLGQEGLLTFEEHDGGPKGWHMNFVFVVDAKADGPKATCDEYTKHRWFGLKDFPLNDLVPDNVRAITFILTVPSFTNGRATSRWAKQRFLDEVHHIWSHRFPYMRFSQMLVNLIPGLYPNPKVFHMEDEPFLKHLSGGLGIPLSRKEALEKDMTAKEHLLAATKLLGMSVEAAKDIEVKLDNLLKSLGTP